MTTSKKSNYIIFPVFIILSFFLLFLQSCATFNYKTYVPKEEEDDPEPNYNITLDQDFQDFTNYMFIGNRIENFSTYFNTYYNAKDLYDEAYEDYLKRVLPTYFSRLDNIYAGHQLSQEIIDKFNKAIEKASKVIQYHKSSQFMDRSVLLIGKSYFYLGDHVKAERKFSEIISRLTASKNIDEALLFLSKTQLRLNNVNQGLERLDQLIKTSKNKDIIAEAYQTLGEYYIYKKNYTAAITNYRKSIEYSSDNEFKAQMQYVVAVITARSDPKTAAFEFSKVLDYGPSYEQEFFARYNYAQNLIISDKLSSAKPVIEQLEVKYKDVPEYLSQVMLLNARYYDQRKDFSKALREYLYVIKNFDRTSASSDASYYIGKYYEDKQKNYLKAIQFYTYSNEQSSAGTNNLVTTSKIKTLRKYFDLRSIITGNQIKTDYDSTFNKMLEKENLNPGEEKPKDPGDQGKGGGYVFSDSNVVQIDSVTFRVEKVAKAKFELAELFSYDLYNPDSSEYYFKSAFVDTKDSELKSKSLFALAMLYKNTDRSTEYESMLRQIVEDFPYTSITNETRRLLDLPVTDNADNDAADSLYYFAEAQLTAKNYDASLAVFKQIINAYTQSKYYTKSIYAAGWIYENALINNDSSFFYYSKLLDSNPGEEFSAIVSPKVEAYINSLQPVSDSAQMKDTTVIKKDGIKEEKKLDGIQEDGSPKFDDSGEPVKEEKKILDDIKIPKKEGSDN